MKKTPATFALLLSLGGTAMAQTSIKIVNPGFADGTTPSATGWTPVDGGGTNNAPSNYVGSIPNLGTPSMQIKSDGGNYLEQPLILTAADEPISASSFGTWSVSFLKGYRRDAVRRGDHVIRVSIWNTTANIELAGSDLTILDPGSTGTNSLSPTTVVLNYDSSLPALAGAGLAVRFTSTSEDLGGSAWQRTAMLDDVSVVAGVIDPRIEVATVAPFANDGAPSSYTINFTNQGATASLAISGVTFEGADAGYFTATSFTANTAPGGSGQIQIGFDPDGSRIYTANAVIASNAAGSPTTIVPITAIVTDPVIAFDSPSVDFGSFPANPGLQTSSLVVRNDGGSADLVVLDAQFVGFGGNGFEVVSLPLAIAPGGSGNLALSFDPGIQGGDFSDLLRIESNSVTRPVIYVPVKARTAFTPAAKAVTVVNANFDAAGWNSATGTAPQGWFSSLAATNTQGNYGQTSPTTPNLTSIAAHMQSAAGYYQQDLTANNPGLDGSSSGTVTVSFDCGYRNDTVTSGPILFRVEIRDLTSGSEIAGRDVALADTGVVSGTASNVLSRVSLHMKYPAGNEPLALRITQLEPQLAVNPYESTVIFDNVSVAVDGTWQPAANAFAGWALANGLDGTPGKEDGATDDPDKDGRSNFDEFAFGGLPLSGSSSGLVAVSTFDTGSDSLKELVLTVAVRSGAIFISGSTMTATVDGIAYEVQGSTDLADFSTLVEGPLEQAFVPSTLPASAPAGYKYLSFRLSGSNGLPSRGFLTAKATAAP